jgi:hypothetical protein
LALSTVKLSILNITIRKTLRTFAWVIGVFLTIWMLVWIYVLVNKKMIIGEVTAMIKDKVKGDITIGDLDPSLVSTFPFVSIRLTDVTLRDSLWKQHKHELVNAKDVWLRLGLWGIFSGSPKVNKIIVQDGAFYLFRDSTGYSNDYIFKSNSKGGGDGKPSDIPDVELKKVRVTMDFLDRNKLYDFAVEKLKCVVKNREELVTLDVKTAMFVHSLAFNKTNGSFVKEKPLDGHFKLKLTRKTKTLSFDNIQLKIDGHPFRFTGMFNFSTPPPLYKLTIQTNDINYRKASALVSYNISKKLDSFNIEAPLDVTAHLDGSKRPNRNPLINIDAVVKNSGLSTPIGSFTNASFKGHFSNQLSLAEKRTDKNSGFLFTDFSGVWEGIKLNSDSIRISNLLNPILKCDLKSEFAMKELNDLLGSNTIAFTKGSSKLDIRYHGSITPGDTSGSSIYGDLSFSDATIYYIPRKISLTDCSGKLEFDDQDVYVRRLKAQSGNTSLLMNGGVKNLLTLIDESPEKLILNWNIASPNLNLADFTSFLQKRTTAAQNVSTRRKFMKLTNQLDKMMQDCSVELQLNAEKLRYKKFDATNVAANLKLTDRVIALRNVLVQHAGGSLSLTGSLKEEKIHNSINLSASMNNVDIQKVFTSFNNFGQDGIMDRNLRGNLTTKINLVAGITDKAEILSNSLKGVIVISLKNGRLIDFEPVQKISERAFKNRDFSDIRFAELKDKLQVDGSQIKINRMEIQSTVLTMFVEGIYDVKKGTDLSIQVPLSNLRKRDQDEELVNKGVASKTGVSLRLRAKTGEDGKAKISWDPFNLALKQNDKSANDTLDIAKDKNQKAEAKDKDEKAEIAKEKDEKADVAKDKNEKPDLTKEKNQKADVKDKDEKADVAKEKNEKPDAAKNKNEKPVTDSTNNGKKKPEKINPDSTNGRKSDTTTIKKNIP